MTEAERIKVLEARVAELEAELPRRKDHRADFAADAFYVGGIYEPTDEDCALLKGTDQ